MKLTQEQKSILGSEGNIKINAVAGSGKTTTVVAYAQTRPSPCKILYLAFNRSVKLEALKKFREAGLTNVHVETAHSLAFRQVVRAGGYRVKSGDYKTYEIVEILGIQGSGERLAEYMVANHINKFVAYFCNSDAHKVQELNYLDTVTDDKARTFVTNVYPYLEKMTRLFLAKMNDASIEITHDFYLKKFQLAKPTLGYDYILFDEGQDASPAMLDIFLRQKATKVIVGDTHQQIYGWRHAVNSLEKADFKNYHLSTSFRFSEDIAHLAVKTLELKKIIGEQPSFKISGKGNHTIKKSKAIIARTNLGLLLKAIEYVSEGKHNHKVYFEGNINSYTYADQGTSLYDVLSLYNRNFNKIRDKLIGQMKSLEELEEYIEKTEEKQLGMMVEIVKEYGNEIPGIIQDIKEKHVEGDEKQAADMVFSTVHRCKGMEYDSVQLVGDFIQEESLRKLTQEKSMDEVNIAKLNEEINLLYVAITRARTILTIPETLVPDKFPKSKHIRLLKAEKKNEDVYNRFTLDLDPQVSNTVSHTVNQQHGSYTPWTIDLDEELTNMYFEGVNIKDLASHFGRSKGAIKSRVRKLKLEDL